jgi:uncharacterized YccA/Bax inhibitor family protein
MIRSNNPALNARVFSSSVAHSGEDVMTLNGTVMKTFFLTALLVTSAAYTYGLASSSQAPSWFVPALKFGWILPAVLALIIGFVPRLAGLLSPIYAVTKGAVVGIMTLAIAGRHSDLILTSVLLTAAVLCALLGAYATRIIRPTENFKLGVFAATGGVALFYLVSWGLSFFGITIPGIHGSGWVSIGFSGFVVVLASMNLVLDFDFIEHGVDSRAPKHLEWYGAWGLLVTLVWLYIEILRLLSKLRSRN